LLSLCPIGVYRILKQTLKHDYRAACILNCNAGVDGLKFSGVRSISAYAYSACGVLPRCRTKGVRLATFLLACNHLRLYCWPKVVISSLLLQQDLKCSLLYEARSLVWKQADFPYFITTSGLISSERAATTFVLLLLSPPIIVIAAYKSSMKVDYCSSLTFYNWTVVFLSD